MIRSLRVEAALAACAVLLACSGDGGAALEPTPPAPPAALSRLDVEPPGASCAAGGTAVRTGLDLDADGVLDDGEVTSTSYLCAEPARVLLLRADAEPAGANCPIAGVAVRAGRDADGDGLLGDAEVERVSYQCGAEAPAPPAVLTRTEGEAAGVNCPAGGTRVDAGPDRDANGLLDDAEVEEVRYVCGDGAVLARTSATASAACRGDATTVRAGADADGDGLLSDAEVATTAEICSPVVGSYPITSQADLDWLVAHVDLVRGDLSLRGSALVHAVLAGVAVSGDVRLEDNPALVSASLLPLALGGNVVVARNPSLETLSLSAGPSRGGVAPPLPGSVTIADAPRLGLLVVQGSAIGGSLTVARTGLRYFALDDLAHVGGSFVVDDNDALTSCAARHVAYVGGDLVLQGNDAMVSPFDWTTFIGRPDPATHDGDTVVVGSIVVRDNALLQWIGYIPATAARDVRIESNPVLSSVNFYDLVAISRDWIITDNPKLGNFGSASEPLRTVGGSILVARNPALTATAGLFPLQSVGGDLTIAGSPELTYLFLPNLVRVEDLRLEDTGVAFLGPDGTANGAADTLTRLEFARSITLAGNRNLARMDLPRLVRAGSLTVQGSPSLPTCQAQTIATRAGAALTVSGTDDAATCP